MISNQERTVIRDLARRVAEVAALPIQEERRRLWRKHHRLQSERPMILVFPEGSWRELLPGSACQCTDSWARGFEWGLRSRLYQHEHFHDDSVIEKEWGVWRGIRDSGWGLEARWHKAPGETGAGTFDPVILEPADLKKIRFPEVTVDEKATAENLDRVRDLLGDILDVRLKGVAHISFHLMSLYTHWRGLAETMMDMYLNPGMLHDAMALLEEGHHRLVRQYADLNLFSLNNDGTYHSSGGLGYTDELPAPGFDPARVRPQDMWSSAEAQEMAQVSPAMHAEFVMAYEKRLLEPFGLNGYGCCEDLTLKLDDVLTIPHIRRISIAPWANVDRCAVKLGSRAIFSWKPNPAHLVGRFNPEALRTYIRHTIEVARASGCCLEMILKDTHTCENHPERFTEWMRIAREEVEAAV